jgi:coniferyl-aldehyde dehydrogenase
MNAINPIDTGAKVESALSLILDRQRAAFLRDGPPSLAARRRDLMKLKNELLARKEEFVTALDHDFGHRARQETLLLDIGSVVETIKYLHRNLRRFMRPERRSTTMVFFPGSNQVVYQPLGVVGVVAPWNYPVSLALAPLATAIAAGNRVMLKPSEFTPATTALLADMLSQLYAEDQVAVVSGDANVAAEFTKLKFDHILFTGSTPVGRLVMRAASENLVPVTLELGGKSPVIIERGTSLDDTAYRIAHGKLANGGQTCVAPDYVLVHEDEVETFTAAFEQAVDRLYPNIATNPDYTWVINDHHFARLTGLVSDAVAKGARMIEIGAKFSGSSASQSRLFLPKLLLGVTDAMEVMHEEIFGPILPIVPYRELDDAIAYVNARPQPLALYVFGPDGPGRRRVLERTTSGNVTVNDTLFHYVQDDLPFGGVGASGMGAYHGPEGFKTLSHAKGIYTQARFNVAEGIRPPFGWIFNLLSFVSLR